MSLRQCAAFAKADLAKRARHLAHFLGDSAKNVGYRPLVDTSRRRWNQDPEANRERRRMATVSTVVGFRRTNRMSGKHTDSFQSAESEE
jgi:hypothetical protein